MPLEPEEEAAEREAAAEEERRKAETLSDIEVTAPALLPEGPALLKLQHSAFCPSEPTASGLGGLSQSQGRFRAGTVSLLPQVLL